MLNYKELYGNDVEKMDSVELYEGNKEYYTSLVLAQLYSNCNN